MPSRKAAHFAPGVAVDDGARNGGGTGGGGIGGYFASPKKKSVSIVGSTNSVDGGLGSPVEDNADIVADLTAIAQVRHDVVGMLVEIPMQTAVGA